MEGATNFASRSKTTTHYSHHFPRSLTPNWVNQGATTVALFPARIVPEDRLLAAIVLRDPGSCEGEEGTH